MAQIAARRAVGGENYGDSLKQVVKLARGTYGLMLARYTKPKLVKKFNSDEEEEKMFLSFVVTHDRTNTQLRHFSEAFLGVRPTLFFDPVTNKMSNYVAVVYALMGGKVPKEQIAPADANVAPFEFDWDELVGRPGLGFIEPSDKADKNGLFSNRLKSLEPPDDGLRKAIMPLWKARKEDSTEKDGLVYLTYPATAYQDDADADGNGISAPPTDPLDEEVPF